MKRRRPKQPVQLSRKQVLKQHIKPQYNLGTRGFDSSGAPYRYVKAGKDILVKNALNMDEQSRKNLEEIERSDHPTGIGRIERGECPTDGRNAIACQFCLYGHMLHCHHPHTCRQAECGHYLAETEAEADQMGGDKFDRENLF